MVAAIGNEDVPESIDEQTMGATESSAGGQATVAAEPKGSIPGHRLNIPRGGHHFPDAIVVSLGDEDVSESIDEQTMGATESSAGGGATVAAEAFGSISSDGRQLPK